MPTFSIQALLGLARQAGAAILAKYPVQTTFHSKADGSPVTQADWQAHQILTTELKKLTPSIPILSEESCDQFTPSSDPLAPFWAIDPLDGTRDFIQSTNEFSVNIALIEQGTPVCGVVHAPALNTTYFAMRGKGAYRQIAHQPPLTLCLPLPAKIPCRIAVSRHHPAEKLADFLTHLSRQLLTLESHDTRRKVHQNSSAEDLLTTIPCGSALKFGLVAESRIDLYPRFGTTSIWDTAAGQCLIEEAGGQVINEQGEPLRYLLHHGFKNPHFLAIADPAKVNFYLKCIPHD